MALSRTTRQFSALDFAPGGATNLYGINDNGEIVGAFLQPGFDDQAFVATPVSSAAPEPPGTSLLAIGGVVAVILGGWMHRRRSGTKLHGPILATRVCQGEIVVVSHLAAKSSRVTDHATAKKVFRLKRRWQAIKCLKQKSLPRTRIQTREDWCCAA